MKLSFMLVEPAVPENVGAVARAMKTMGFYDLLLVNPCDHLSGPARWLAHGSAEILEDARIFSSVDRAVAGFDLIIGTTAKRRSVKNDYYNLTELPAMLHSKGDTVEKAVVVFGREESGLHNEELKMCDFVTTIPMKTTFPSLNLAQAVMLYSWELSKSRDLPFHDRKYLQENSLKVLNQKVKTVLLETGFREDSAIFSRYFERINTLSDKDINLIHSFCNKFLNFKK